MDLEVTELNGLIDRLYAMVTEAWGVPLGNDRCIIERAEALEIINTMKARLPVEIAEAKRLLMAREEFISNAKREADSVRRVAEDRAQKLVEREEVVKTARALSTELVTRAENKSQELTKVTNDYVNDALRRTEEALAAALDELRQTRERFRNASGTRPVQQPQVRQREIRDLDDLDDDVKTPDQ